MTRTYDDDGCVQPTLAESARDVLRMAITPTPLPNPDEQIRDLVRQVTELQDAKEAMSELLAKFSTDLSTMADALRDEAISRDWCSDYGNFVDEVNGRMSQPWLAHCMEDRVASFTVAFNFVCRHGRVEECIEALREALRESGAYELPNGASIEDIDVTMTGSTPA